MGPAVAVVAAVVAGDVTPRGDVAADDPAGGGTERRRPRDGARTFVGWPRTTVAPTREDPVARSASAVLGGPAGEHLGEGGSRWRPEAVLVAVVTAVVAGALLLRQHCRTTVFADPDQLVHACYSDIPSHVVATRLGQGAVPFLDPDAAVAAPQPAGSAALLWLLGLVTPGGPLEPRHVFDLAVVVLAVAAIAVVVAVARLHPHRPWDALLVAASPVLLTASLVSLDLVAVALAVLGVLAASRGRAWKAGVLVGAAAVVHPLAGAVLLALLVTALRPDDGGAGHSAADEGSAGAATRSTRSDAGRTAVAAAATWLAVNLPLALAAPDAWRTYWQTTGRVAGYGSVWLLPELAAAEQTAGSLRLSRAVQSVLARPVPEQALRWVVLAVTVLAVAAVLTWAVRTPRPPRVPVVVLVLLVAVLVPAASVPVQAAVWVLPFAALAVPRWRVLLVWGGVEAAYATVTWLYAYGLSESSRGAPPWLYGLLLVTRLATLVWLARQAVVIARDPATDPVRTSSADPDRGADDPVRDFSRTGADL
ncbi:glycosyltransferase 87 family protein [Thalassiella azotivora]